ncbi:SurA N-terminal domain-containing protein [Polymorphum gilvum]|uniref:Parvulin-like PPIase n=1 Tax=Polymorphum gilvum (strain LMG 25793 / CGMCC 1.9160 / SL003B-26A1) TaxID=991905 RepID=F2IYZ5_POLGS|nr:SurA N-terminal domain-containing protein [Polymorphum gilvum]ADZ70610.1 PpiC-type peptidyl-prolyl cis-trans isomerase [Polymorphum gilvum SL003B-26A1]
MLDALRKGAGTFVAKIFIALLILSFAVWGIADIFQGFGRNVAARVGDTEISLQSFDQAYRRELSALSRQIGRPLSTTEGAQIGLPQQVLGRLVAEAALDDDARAMTLGISDAELIRVIQADPVFQRPGGGFDRARLAQLLRANGISEDDYVVERRRLAERQQIAEALSGSLISPQVLLEAFNAYQNETRTVRYLLLTPAAVGSIAEPDDAALEAYFDDNRAAFRAPEYRRLALLELTPDAVARPDEVTDADARSAYERAGSRFSEDERRRVRQMPFPDADAARAAAERLASGASFAELMAERNLAEADVDLGLMRKSDFLDPAIAEAAFALDEGAVSGAVEGRFATVILEAAEIRPAATRPFEEVRDELKQEIARERAEREVLDIHDEIEDARAGGAALAEIAERFKLALATPPALDATGKAETGATVSLPDGDGLLREAFDSDVGIENDPLPLGERGFVWYEVAEVIPARDRPLDEVRPSVVIAWGAAERIKRLADLSAGTADRLKAGESLDVVAADLGLEVKTSAPLKRATDSGDFTAAAAGSAFSGPAGTVAEAAGKDGNRIVMMVDAISSPAFFMEADEVKAIDEQVARQLQDSLLNQYVSEIERTRGVEVNQAAIAQVLGLGGGS